MKSWSDEKTAWLALYLIQGLGNSVYKKLLERFGSPQSVFDADLNELMKVNGLKKDAANRIIKREFVSSPEEELRLTEKCGARIITYMDPGYPEILKHISSPPMVLYIKGKDIPIRQTLVGIVGSRNPTHYGLRSAEKIALGLARRKIGVVSGLARGIDSAAHRGCLQGEGFTAGVLGTGINLVYPSANRKLFDQITENGAIISEFPVNTPPEPRNFPIRNRIVSGLCKGIVVVEATRKSGSLITASFALEQNREVFAVPGSIDSPQSTGTHFLIKQGARLIEKADDILEEFGFNLDRIKDLNVLKDKSNIFSDMDESEKKVYEVLGDYPVHIDEIVRTVSMKTGEVSGILMKMELKSIVKQLAGKMFIR
ncbi:MAG: DNA-processing protein DprA [Deltaproteobacteria bacterium]|nr:DNA-processing protein DprA [Deltaproteobacteria bacterium]